MLAWREVKAKHTLPPHFYHLSLSNNAMKIVFHYAFEYLFKLR